MRRVIGLMLVLLVAAMIAVGAAWLWQSVPGSRLTAPEAAAERSRERRTMPVEAELPWVRDIADARPVRVSLASSAWSSRRPGRAFLPSDIPQATCPWVRDVTGTPARVSAPIANVPWRPK